MSGYYCKFGHFGYLDEICLWFYSLEISLKRADVRFILRSDVFYQWCLFCLINRKGFRVSKMKHSQNLHHNKILLPVTPRLSQIQDYYPKYLQQHCSHWGRLRGWLSEHLQGKGVRRRISFTPKWPRWDHCFTGNMQRDKAKVVSLLTLHRCRYEPGGMINTVAQQSYSQIVFHPVNTGYLRVQTLLVFLKIPSESRAKKDQLAFCEAWVSSRAAVPLAAAPSLPPRSGMLCQGSSSKDLLPLHLLSGKQSWQSGNGNGM